LVHRNMVILLKHVKIHAINLNISLYKMEMDKQDGVVVMMTLLMSLNMVQINVLKLEVHGVIMYMKILVMNI